MFTLEKYQIPNPDLSVIQSAESEVQNCSYSTSDSKI